MNARLLLIRRTAGDYIQRTRIAFTNLGDAAGLVDLLDRDIAEEVTKSMCEYLGLDYYPPNEAPTPEGKDKAAKARAASPWKRKRGINLSPNRPDLDKR